jgi:hypothetical protein
MRVYSKFIAGVVLAGAAAGCVGETAEERANAGADTLPQTGSYYARDADSGMAVEGTATGSALTAPAIIPPVRLSLDRLTAGSRSDDDANRSAHKVLLADLVAAMQTDMNRLGVSDNADLQALGDSVVNEVGGGAGVAEGPAAADVRAHVERVERLITLYESKVGSAGAASATRPAGR